MVSLLDRIAESQDLRTMAVRLSAVDAIIRYNPQFAKDTKLDSTITAWREQVRASELALSLTKSSPIAASARHTLPTCLYAATDFLSFHTPAGTLFACPFTSLFPGSYVFRFPHPEGNGATATPLLRHLSSYLFLLEGLRGPSGLHLLFPLGVLENRTSLCSPPLEGPRGPSSLRRLQRLRLPRRHLVRPARPARPVRPLSGPMTGRPRRHGRPPVLLRRRRCLPPGRPPELFFWTLGPSSSGPAP
ncbi:unnamed protein product [Oreochromis niloticus]|nr:unnamed protein product [Mustela putorius furo]